MDNNELQEVIDWLGSTDTSTLDLNDQLKLMTSYNNFAEAVRPIMLHYKTLRKETYFFKI